MLSRNLLDYRWELRGNKTILIDKKSGITLTLDKVRLMSFMKFAPNCLDKMRIEESKKSRKRISDLRNKIKELNEQRKIERKIAKAKKAELSAKARKVNNV